MQGGLKKKKHIPLLWQEHQDIGSIYLQENDIFISLFDYLSFFLLLFENWKLEARIMKLLKEDLYKKCVFSVLNNYIEMCFDS